MVNDNVSGFDARCAARRRRAGGTASTSARGEEVNGFVVDDRTGPSDEPVAVGRYRGAVVFDKIAVRVPAPPDGPEFLDLASLYPGMVEEVAYRELNDRVARAVAGRLPPI